MRDSRSPLHLTAAVAVAACLTLAACTAPSRDSTNSAVTRPSPSDPAGRAAANCTPLETRAANAAEQKPAIARQTRTCGVAASTPYNVTVVAKGLSKPWSVEPLPGGDLLVTEKGGQLRIVSAAGAIGEPIAGVPPVDAKGQGGLLDVALSPSFDTDRMLYWSFSEPRQGGNATSVARGRLSTDRTKLENVQVILRTMPVYNNNMHFGSRLAFGPDGKLFVTMGERSDTPMRPQAQQLDSHLGKILRINADGTVPTDNPFSGQANAKAEIWSIGHRNVQAAAIDAQGRLWGIEHGTQGGDELNLVQKGKNYGWPVQAYGEEYSGQPIGGAVTVREGMEQPTYYWDPVIAPSGAQFYSGNAFPAWKGNLFVGSLKEMRLVRLVIENDRVTAEEHLLTDRGQRIRDVKQGPDGALYVVTDQESGELWRIHPK